jgi:hypothetical protein
MDAIIMLKQVIYWHNFVTRRSLNINILHYNENYFQYMLHAKILFQTEVTEPGNSTFLL